MNLNRGGESLCRRLRGSTPDASIAPSCSRVVPLQTDASDRTAFGALTGQASDVALLVNNAGMIDLGSVLEAEATAFERNFTVNFLGTLNAKMYEAWNQDHKAVQSVRRDVTCSHPAARASAGRVSLPFSIGHPI